MMWIVCYDIEDDRVRTRVADECLNKGLERIQYSVFMGHMTDGLARELAERCRIKMGKFIGQVRFIPISQKELQKAMKVQVGKVRLERLAVEVDF